MIQCEKNPAATTCGGLSPRQTLPPVCTPRQMTIGLKAWLAQRSPIQYLFSQFKALAAAHLVSAVQSNAPLIATVRLRSHKVEYCILCQLLTPHLQYPKKWQASKEGRRGFEGRL